MIFLTDAIDYFIDPKGEQEDIEEGMRREDRCQKVSRIGGELLCYAGSFTLSAAIALFGGSHLIRGLPQEVAPDCLLASFVGSCLTALGVALRADIGNKAIEEYLASNDCTKAKHERLQKQEHQRQETIRWQRARQIEALKIQENQLRNYRLRLENLQ